MCWWVFDLWCFLGTFSFSSGGATIIAPVCGKNTRRCNIIRALKIKPIYYCRPLRFLDELSDVRVCVCVCFFIFVCKFNVAKTHDTVGKKTERFLYIYLKTWRSLERRLSIVRTIWHKPNGHGSRSLTEFPSGLIVVKQ